MGVALSQLMFLHQGKDAGALWVQLFSYLALAV